MHAATVTGEDGNAIATEGWKPHSYPQGILYKNILKKMMMILLLFEKHYFLKIKNNNVADIVPNYVLIIIINSYQNGGCVRMLWNLL